MKSDNIFNLTENEVGGKFSSLTIVTLTLLSPMIICIIIGNLLVVLAVYRNHDLRTPTNLILTSLAVANFLSGFAIPLEMHITVLSGFIPCLPKITALYSIPLYVLLGCSFLHILVLTADRYFAITKPLNYHALVTHRRVGITVTVMWVSTTAFFFIRDTVSVSSDTDSTSFWCEGDPYDDSLKRGLNWGLLAIQGVVISALIFCNVRILKIAIRQANVIDSQRIVFCQGDVVVELDGKHSRLKAVKTTALIVGVFLICWVPSPLFVILRLTTQMSKELQHGIYYLMIVMSTVNAAVNPLIYCYRYTSFRRAFQDILTSLNSCKK